MPPSNLQNLGSLILRERGRRQLTIRQLADASGLTPSHVSRLEVGQVAEPRPKHLQQLARGLGIEVEELYTAVGYSVELPELKPYLRAKYGLSDDAVGQIEGYVQAIKDTNQSSEEVRHDGSRDTSP